MSYDKKVFSNNVRALRKSLNLHQYEFADMLGVSTSTICKIEQGLGNPTLDTVVRLMHVSKQSLDFFLEDNTALTIYKLPTNFHDPLYKKTLEDRLEGIENDIERLKIWKGEPL